MTDPDVLSVPAAAEYLGVSNATVYRMIDRYGIPTHRSFVGNRLRIKLGDLKLIQARMRGEDIDE